MRYSTFFYDLIAPVYPFLDAVFMPRDTELMAALSALPSSSILDIGAGNARFWATLPQHQVTAVDASEVMLHSGFGSQANIETIACRWEDFSSEKQYEIVLFQHSLSLLSDPEMAVDKALKLLRPKGLLLVQNYDSQLVPKWLSQLIRFPTKLLNFDSNFSTSHVDCLQHRCHLLDRKILNPLGLFSLEIYQLRP